MRPIGGDMTTLQQPVQRARDAAQQPEYENRAVTRLRGLGALMARRPELAGVYTPADVTAEAIRWSA